MKYILSLIISGALVVSGFGQTRNVLVGTNNAVVQPTNFWSADAANAKVGLGLGTTNIVEFGQIYSDDFGILNNAIYFGGQLKYEPETQTFQGDVFLNNGSLTIDGTNAAVKIAATRTNLGLPWNGLTSADAPTFRIALGLGTAATNPATAFQASSATLSNMATSNGGSLTNLQATSLVGVIPSSNIATVNFSNLAGTLSIASGGTSATNAADARQNLGSTLVGDAVFIATNEAAARSAIGALATNGNGAGLTNLTAANITGTVALASNLSSPLALTNGGTGATNAATARTNLGLGWSALTNTDATNFRNAIGIGTTNSVQFGSVAIGDGDLIFSNNSIYWGTNFRFSPEDGVFGIALNFETPTIAAATRTNLGLPWSGLTNTNAATFQAALFGANTNPVLVDTNGGVISPTNFWQAAPIATALQNSAPNATNTAATNARLLFLFSLTNTTVGVTNTFTNIVQLPTNGNTFNGDVATITHNGGSNTVTAIRQLGATNNIITLNQPDETVRFLYRDNQWELMDNISYIEPIYFSGTNAAANAAASRTNLGLNDSYEPVYLNLTVTEAAGTNGNVQFTADGIGFDTETARAQYRNSLGLGAINNVSFSNVTAAGTLTATGTVTATTNLVVNGFVDYTAARTNNTPTNTPNFAAHAAWIEVKIGTNSFFLPAYQ